MPSSCQSRLRRPVGADGDPVEEPRRGHVSAGLLMYRLRLGQLEVFIGHPGGPWQVSAGSDDWTIPKGVVQPNESLINAAVREFSEEVGLTPQGPYLDLGRIRQRGGKTVYAWAFSGDWTDGRRLSGCEVEIEWPPGSGRRRRWPELDDARFFTVAGAKQRLKLEQQPFLDRLAEHLGENEQSAVAVGRRRTPRGETA